MLVLSQRTGDYTTLTVAPSTTPTVIRKTVVRLGTQAVRDGWDAPAHVTIVRSDAKPRTRIDQQEND